MGSVVMWYQSSLLNKEWRVLEEERDLYLGKGKVCDAFRLGRILISKHCRFARQSWGRRCRGRGRR